jgi:hypothetical protein
MMCTISKETIAFCAGVERQPGEIFAASPIALHSGIISWKRIALYAEVEATRGQILAASAIAVQSRCQLISNEPIPIYGQSWPQHRSNHPKLETDRKRRNDYTEIRGQYLTRCGDLMLGAGYPATAVSRTAPTERVHLDGGILPRWKYFLLMEVI